MNQLSPSTVPAHVAIIMDGNGRWANARGLPRAMGHRKGVEAVREAVKTAGECGISYLTLFAFSSENWNRPESEVSDLMGLLKTFIRRDLAVLHRQNVRIRIIGDRENLSGDILPLLLEAEETTRANSGITLVIAFNYGSRDEITRAMRRLAADVAAGRLDAAAITPARIGAALDTASIPDPDLIIRTSGGAAFQFPAVAGGLCRADVHSRFLAGFFARDLPVRTVPLCHAGTPVRRPSACHHASGGVLMQSELRLRILSGIVLAVVVLAATWFGGFFFRALSAAIALLVYYEWSTMTRLMDKDFRGNAFGWLSVALIAGLVLFGFDDLALPLLIGATGLGVLYACLSSASGWLPGGIVYSGLTAISLAAIRGEGADGFAAMVFIFAVVWATDILAYFIGRAIGGPKLAPSISPGKTWSGAIGGAVSAVFAGTLVHMAFFPLNGLWVPAIALVLSVFSQVGDLFESFIKRRFGVKDSSRLIPGHGGVMDRVDGLVFACFAAFLIALGDALVSGSANTPAGVFLFGP